jgi:hypothetical protein
MEPSLDCWENWGCGDEDCEHIQISSMANLQLGRASAFVDRRFGLGPDRTDSLTHCRLPHCRLPHQGCRSSSSSYGRQPATHGTHRLSAATLSLRASSRRPESPQVPWRASVSPLFADILSTDSIGIKKIMFPSDSPPIARFFLLWGAEESECPDELVRPVEPEQGRTAHGRMRGERQGQMLQATAPVNEACLKPVNQSLATGQNRRILPEWRSR